MWAYFVVNLNNIHPRLQSDRYFLEFFFPFNWFTRLEFFVDLNLHYVRIILGFKFFLLFAVVFVDYGEVSVYASFFFNSLN